MKMSARITALSLVSFVLFAACDGSTLSAPPAGTPTVTDPNADGGDGTGTDSDGGVVVDPDGAPATDGAPPTFSDGTPTRMTCSSTLGMGLSPDHGRLGGTLVSIVPATGAHCSSDPDHLHLQ